MPPRHSKPIAFTGVVRFGHKVAAVQLPFDPSAQWGMEATGLWKGRRGHRVQGTLQGWDFTGVVVPRAGYSWLLLPQPYSTGLTEGDEIHITLAPVRTDKRFAA